MSAFASAAGAPIIRNETLLESVRADFGVSLSSMSQVYGGQDSDAVVLRAVTVSGAAMAVKVSSNMRVGGLLTSALLAATIPYGIPTPVLSRSGLPYSLVSGRRLSLTPWIAGHGAYDAGMDAHQWRSFGALLSQVHAVQVPATVADHLLAEDYRTPAAAVARALDERVRQRAASSDLARSDDSPAGALIREWRAAGDALAMILAHIDDLGDELRASSATSVVCHGDAHIGNLQLGDDSGDGDSSDGGVWLLDWDEVVRAPRERDLMFVIGGVIARAPVTAEQQKWFFDGYGPANIDPNLLAYYRCSWALQDVADFAARILDQPDGGSLEAGQALRLFRDVVSPTGIVLLAARSLHQIGRVPDLT
ncbi:MAG: aminoglycoside phosphotransferase family protein [Actinomycetota bacterium]|nr:aminoglycoside phosphotransferase family protein [Actinomycetota bacterium]